MAYKIIYTPIALFEVDETADWYEKELSGLGKRFLLDISSTIEILKRNPFTFSILYNDIRRAGLKKFPFIILYIINDLDINIIGVINTKRSKRYIRRRLKRR